MPRFFINPAVVKPAVTMFPVYRAKLSLSVKSPKSILYFANFLMKPSRVSWELLVKKRTRLLSSWSKALSRSMIFACNASGSRAFSGSVTFHRTPSQSKMKVFRSWNSCLWPPVCQAFRNFSSLLLPKNASRPFQVRSCRGCSARASGAACCSAAQKRLMLHHVSPTDRIARPTLLIITARSSRVTASLGLRLARSPNCPHIFSKALKVSSKCFSAAFASLLASLAAVADCAVCNNILISFVCCACSSRICLNSLTASCIVSTLALRLSCNFSRGATACKSPGFAVCSS
mmetsp:Transcript_75857/g.212666  ORF Transcript_75857/g.212666 Transcript_75857/m.212666 type:complete len:289 (-) Transcript_75857:66-932(-)